jgi:hypothetical protein
MDPDLIKRWSARWQAVEQWEIEELRNSSVQDSWRKLNAAFALAKGVQLVPIGGDGYPDEEQMAVYERWVKLRVALRDRR